MTNTEGRGERNKSVPADGRNCANNASAQCLFLVSRESAYAVTAKSTPPVSSFGMAGRGGGEKKKEKVCQVKPTDRSRQSGRESRGNAALHNTVLNVMHVNS